MKKGILCLVTLFLCLSSGVSYAQGQGVSGPNTKGFKTNTDEMVLTRKGLEEILGSCMSVELLELSRLLSKNSAIDLDSVYDDSPAKEFFSTIYGNPGHGGPLFAEIRFSDRKANNGIVNVFGILTANIVDDNHFGRFEISFTQGYNNAISIPLVANSAPVLHYEEAALADSYDEYGNVLEEKIVITQVRWNDRSKLTNEPIDLSAPLQFSNSRTNIPIKSLSFNQPRYVECVNLKLGKYASQTP